MRHLLLPTKLVPDWWDVLEPFVKKAVDKDVTSTAPVRDGLLAGTLQGLLVLDGETVCGFVTWKLLILDGRKRFIVETLGGKQMHRWWEGTLQALQNIAQTIGAEYFEFTTQRNADRFCRKMGFEPTATVYRRKLS